MIRADEFPTSLDDIPLDKVANAQDTTADSATRFENGYIVPGVGRLMCCDEAGETSTNHNDALAGCCSLSAGQRLFAKKETSGRRERDLKCFTAREGFPRRTEPPQQVREERSSHIILR